MTVVWRRVNAFALVCLISQFADEGRAQTYSAKVVRLLVPFSADSGADTIGRIIAGGLTPFTISIYYFSVTSVLRYVWLHC